MGRLQKDSKAGLIRRIEELEAQLKRSHERCSILYDRSEAYFKALNAATTELADERWS